MPDQNEDRQFISLNSDGSAYPALEIDWDLYAGYLEDSDLTDDQKREFILTLWNLQLSWVDLWLGIHPVQQACEQNRDLRALLSAEYDAVLDSCHSNNEFNHAAGGSSVLPEGRSR